MDELLGSGFWHSLMGLLAHKGQATIGRVIDLAAKQPFSVKLETADARRILNLGKLAKTAGNNWFNSIPISVGELPKVRLPDVPNINGGNPGDIQASLIVKSPRQGMPPTNITFSMDDTTPVFKALDKVKEFILTYEDRYKNDAEFQEFLDYLRDVPDNWLYGRADLVVPNWMVDVNRINR